MIVDTSALIAILYRESEAEVFIDLIDRNATQMSAASYVEVEAVVDRVGDPAVSRALDDLLLLGDVGIVPVDERQARTAREAYRDFGKGSGHRAQLNFGDCFSYALAKATGEALLYKGQDFGFTDIAAATGA